MAETTGSVRECLAECRKRLDYGRCVGCALLRRARCSMADTAQLAIDDPKSLIRMPAGADVLSGATAAVVIAHFCW